MMEQLRTPQLNSAKTTQEQLLELRKYLYQTIQAINASLNDIDRRLDALEKGETK